MKNYIQLILVGVVVCTTALFSQAQSLSPEVISVAGGKMQSATISLDWTLGEAAVSRWKTPQGFVTEGFHQPVLEVSLLPQYGTTKISIAPNPVQSTLNILVSETPQKPMFAQLVDVQGRVLLQRTSLNLGNTEFNLNNLSAGIYFLQVLQQNGKTVEAFKVVKTH
jgi:Secretion system C-terminal sorting domain